MNLRHVDLNLLVVFDALMNEGSIGRAAGKVGVTPSAVSHALRRLRDTFGDELFERTPEGMVPTQRALDLHGRIASALSEIGRAVDQQLHFAPGSSERTFKVRVSDYLIGCLVPRLCARVRAEAPKVSLIVEYIGDSGRRMEAGELLLRICADQPGPEHDRRCLMQSRFIVAMRADHPAATETLTLDRFVALPQVRVSYAVLGTQILDDMLARQGRSRWTAMAVPTLASVMPILLHSDLCAVLPERWAELYSPPNRLAMLPLPLPDLQFTVDLVWQRADAADAGHCWLRALVEQEFRVLYSHEAGWAKIHDASPDLLDEFPIRLDSG